MNSIVKLYHWKNLLAGIFIITAGILLSHWVSHLLKESNYKKTQAIYLQQIKKDFQRHKDDVTAIYNINKNMLTLIDSYCTRLPQMPIPPSSEE